LVMSNLQFLVPDGAALVQVACCSGVSWRDNPRSDDWFKRNIVRKLTRF